MKKIVSSLVALAAFGALAAPQRLVSLQVAEANGLVAGVSKLCEMVGNPMLSAMAAPTIAQNPVTTFFGPARAGSSVYASAFGDPEAFKADATKFEGWVIVAYPVTQTKEEFLKAHADAVETNGIIRVDDAAVIFSKDGRWAVASDEFDRVQSGLEELPLAEKPLAKDVLVRASVSKAFVQALVAVAEQAEQVHLNKDQLDLVRGVGDSEIALAVSSRGLDLIAFTETIPGTLLDKCGTTALAGDYFTFAGADAIFAQNLAANAGGYDSVKMVKEMVAFIQKQGLKSDYVKIDAKDGIVKTVIDFKSAAAYFKSEEGQKAFEKVDPMTFLTGITAIETNQSFNVHSQAIAGSLAFAGVTPKTSAAARFAKTLPEVITCKPYGVSCGSIYSLFKGLAPQVVEILPAEVQSQVKTLLQTLPEEGECGIAACASREGAKHKVFFRISADELKGLGAIVNAGLGYAMSASMQGSCTMDDDDDEDDDLDDDED